MTYKRIVVGTDGSETACKAVDLAAGLAAALGAKLLIVHAGDNTGVLDAAAERARAYGVAAETEARQADPADVLIDVAQQRDADLIVVGNRGMSHAKRFVIGGVPDKVSHHAPCDVLIARTSRDNAPHAYERVLIATDGSRTADRAARKGFAIAHALDGAVSLVHVGHPKTGEILLRDTQESIGGGADAKCHAVEGPPAEKIIEIAEQDGADLIIIGNRGMSGAKRFLLGSVPQAIAQFAEPDVLIVRTATVFAAEVAKGEGAIITVDGKQIAAYREEDGSLVTLSPKCTHMGCTVGWNANDKTWDCPCHGSRFRVTGENFDGPAPKPLPKIELDA